MIKTSFLNSQKLPLVIEPSTGEASLRSLSETLNSLREFFRDKLFTHGALLFRGYQIDDVCGFERFVKQFSAGGGVFNYAGGVSPRSLLGGGSGVYTSTEYPPHLALSLHNELSYADVFPEKLFFCCLQPAATGGETTLGNSRRILKKIDPPVVNLFKTKKITYIRNLSPEKGSGYSWQEAFETQDKRVAELVCRKIGATFEWQPNDFLRLSQTRPATVKHPVSGEEVWFNQADGFHPSNLDAETYQTLISLFGSEDKFRLNACFGDGSPIDSEALEHIRDVLQRETIPHRWQKGDVLILDNILAAHGRLPFTGERKIALAMT